MLLMFMLALFSVEVAAAAVLFLLVMCTLLHVISHFHSQVAFSCTFHAFLFLSEKKIIIKWCYVLFLYCIILYFNKPK